jgi:hypothetical protein
MSAKPIAERIDAFVSNAYCPQNLASARDQLTQAIFLLQEVGALLSDSKPPEERL